MVVEGLVSSELDTRLLVYSEKAGSSDSGMISSSEHDSPFGLVISSSDSATASSIRAWMSVERIRGCFRRGGEGVLVAIRLPSTVAVWYEVGVIPRLDRHVVDRLLDVVGALPLGVRKLRN